MKSGDIRNDFLRTCAKVLVKGSQILPTSPDTRFLLVLKLEFPESDLGFKAQSKVT